MITLFLDVETTGFSSKDHIVQIAWLVYDDEKYTNYNHVIKPDGFEIPESSTKIHGITTQEALDGGEDLTPIMLKFMEDVDRCDLLVGHNINFDKRMVEQELLRIGTAYHLNHIEKVCTMNSSIKYCGKKPKLQELYVKLFGEEFDGAHDALAAIQATAKWYWELKDLGIIK